MRVGLALGDARVAQLRQDQADVADGALRTREGELQCRREAYYPDDAGLGMQLQRVTELVRQHARDLVRRAGPLHQAARQDDLAARYGKRVDERPVEQDDAHAHWLVGRRCGEPLGQPAERGLACRRLAHLAVLRHRGDNGASERRTRFLRHDARDRLGGVQVQEPHAADDGQDGGEDGEPGLQALPALARAGESRRTRQQEAGE